RRHARLLRRTVDARPLRERRVRLRTQRGGVGDELPRQILVEQPAEQVLRVDLGIAVAARPLERRRDRLLRLDRQLVEVHLSPRWYWQGRCLVGVEDEVAAVLPVHLGDLLLKLAFEPGDAALEPLHFVAEPE